MKNLTGAVAAGLIVAIATIAIALPLVTKIAAALASIG